MSIRRKTKKEGLRDAVSHPSCQAWIENVALDCHFIRTHALNLLYYYVVRQCTLGIQLETLTCGGGGKHILEKFFSAIALSKEVPDFLSD